MSGDNQHFIPQHVLKGFRSPDSPRERRIWVSRKDAEPTLDPIKEIAAQTHFYSEPSADGAETLDDQITKYENRLAVLMRWLRKQPAGPLLNSDVPAEVISHLTQRTESVRTSLSTGTKNMLFHLLGLTRDKDTWRGLMGLDGDTPNPIFRKTLAEALQSNSRFRNLNLPLPALERILFGLARENFDRMHAESSAMAHGALSQMLWRTDSMIEKGHKKALANAMVPEPRLLALRRLKWVILHSNQNLILPDCVAIGIDHEGNAAPVPLADLDDLAHVAIPLSPNRLLVGTKDGAGIFREFLFPLHAAASSERFFLSAIKDASLVPYSKYIGVRSFTLVHEAVTKAVDELKSQKLDGQRGGAEVAPEVPQPAHSVTIDLQFRGAFSPDAISAVSGAVQGIVTAAANYVSLRRLDGITFADDYPAALRNLDRGFRSQHPLQTTDEPDVAGVAMAPLVIRDGVIKSHVVLQSHLGLALIHDREDWREHAVYTIVAELVQVACTEYFDTAFPGILLQPMGNPFDGHRFSTVKNAWDTYFTARVAAQLSPSQYVVMNELLINALRRAAERIPAARLDYRFHGRLDDLLDKSLRDVRFILHHAARVLGHCDGLANASLQAPNADLKAALNKLNLGCWFEFFSTDLRRLSERVGAWTSIQEFMALNVHVERLLWQFGIILWRHSDGQCGVTVPLATDISRLGAETIKRPLWLLKSISRRIATGLLQSKSRQRADSNLRC